MNYMPRRPKVLIVDDTPENIEVLADFLADDYHALVAINGAKALEIAAKEDKPDLILLDVMMPEMDGYEVCRRLKAEESTRHIPTFQSHLYAASQYPRVRNQLDWPRCAQQLVRRLQLH